MNFVAPVSICLGLAGTPFRADVRGASSLYEASEVSDVVERDAEYEEARRKTTSRFRDGRVGVLSTCLGSLGGVLARGASARSKGGICVAA